MILHINYLQHAPATSAGDLVQALFALLEEGRLDPSLLTHLRVWGR